MGSYGWYVAVSGVLYSELDNKQRRGKQSGKSEAVLRSLSLKISFYYINANNPETWCSFCEKKPYVRRHINVP